jgi:adenylylsulfate kinase
MDSHARSLFKAVTWRVGGLLVTTAVAWVLTRRMDIAAAIGLADSLVKVAAFYAHERLWLRISFGQVRPPEYQV